MFVVGGTDIDSGHRDTERGGRTETEIERRKESRRERGEKEREERERREREEGEEKEREDQNRHRVQRGGRTDTKGGEEAGREQRQNQGGLQAGGVAGPSDCVAQ